MAFLTQLLVIKALFLPQNYGYLFVHFYKLSKNYQQLFVFKLKAKQKGKTAL